MYDSMEKRTSTICTPAGTYTRRGTWYVLLIITDHGHERVHHMRYDIPYTRGRTTSYHSSVEITYMPHGPDMSTISDHIAKDLNMPHMLPVLRRVQHDAHASP